MINCITSCKKLSHLIYTGEFWSELQWFQIAYIHPTLSFWLINVHLVLELFQTLLQGDRSPSLQGLSIKEENKNWPACTGGLFENCTVTSLFGTCQNDCMCKGGYIYLHCTIWAPSSCLKLHPFKHLIKTRFRESVCIYTTACVCLWFFSCLIQKS